MPFLVIFIVIPFIELMVFAAVSDEIGIWTALFLAFLTAIIGGILVKRQGLQTLSAIQQSTQAGQMPLPEIFDGFCLVAAGALLITPGFVTDAVGFTLLIPAAREALRNIIKTRTSWAMQDGMGAAPKRLDDNNILEGEYEPIEDDGNSS